MLKQNYWMISMPQKLKKMLMELDLFRNERQKRLLIPQLPSATRSSEVNVRGKASRSLCSHYAYAVRTTSLLRGSEKARLC